MQELMILLGPNNTSNNRERLLEEPMWQYELLKVRNACASATAKRECA